MCEILPLGIVQRPRIVADTLKRFAKRIIDDKKLALQQGDDVVVQQVGEGKDILSRLGHYLL